MIKKLLVAGILTVGVQAAYAQTTPPPKAADPQVAKTIPSARSNPSTSTPMEKSTV